MKKNLVELWNNSSLILSRTTFVLVVPFATLRLPSLMTLNELCQIASLLGHLNELMFEQVFRSGTLEMSRRQR